MTIPLAAPSPTATSRDELLALALDDLGGMWSWRDEYLDDPANAHLWVVQAGRILRDLVGRPARPPAASRPAPGPLHVSF